LTNLPAPTRGETASPHLLEHQPCHAKTVAYAPHVTPDEPSSSHSGNRLPASHPIRYANR
jgi:hypothetical protein